MSGRAGAGSKYGWAPGGAAGKRCGRSPCSRNTWHLDGKGARVIGGTDAGPRSKRHGADRDRGLGD